MQKGNELAVKTFQINNSLQEIINDIYYIESETRKQVNAGNLLFTNSVIDTINHLNTLTKDLEKLTKDRKAANSWNY